MASDIAQLIETLKQADPSDDSLFQHIVSESMRVLNLTDAQVAKEFSAATPTIGRWKNGMATPHPLMRKPIYDWFLNALAKAGE